MTVFDVFCVASAALASADLLRRALRSNRLRNGLGARVVSGLAGGDDLLQLDLRVSRELQTIRAKRIGTGDRGNQNHWQTLEDFVLLAYSAISLERGRVDVALETSNQITDWRQRSVAARRIALVREESLPEAPASTESPLAGLLEGDTLAQLALASGEATRAARVGGLLPITELRVLVATGDLAAARHRLDSIAPSRIEAMVRSFPADAATRFVYDVQRSGPYRA